MADRDVLAGLAIIALHASADDELKGMNLQDRAKWAYDMVDALRNEEKDRYRSEAPIAPTPKL